MVETPHSADPLHSLLRDRTYWRWTFAAQIARLPPLMTALGFVVAGEYATGGVAVGGLMVAVYTMSAVCWSPFGGRRLDRIAPARGSAQVLALSVLVLAALAVAVSHRAPVLVLLLLAALAGAVPAGSAGAMRRLLSDALPSRLLAPAIALDATTLEVMVVAAPLLVAVAAMVTPPAAIIAMAVAAAVAALLVYRLPDGSHAPEHGHDSPTDARWTAWSNPRYLFWLLVSVAFGHALGTAETRAFPLAGELGGGPGAAAGLVAALSVTSALSGIAWAALGSRIAASLVSQASVLLVLLALGCAGLSLASSWVVAIVAMAAIGLCAAPLYTVRSQAAEVEVPASRRSEGFSVLFAANGIGFALGGLLLAVLPLSATLAVGGMSGILALVASPLLLRQSETRRWVR